MGRLLHHVAELPRDGQLPVARVEQYVALPCVLLPPLLLLLILLLPSSPSFFFFFFHLGFQLRSCYASPMQWGPWDIVLNLWARIVTEDLNLMIIVWVAA